MKFFDLQIEFMRPMWRRVALVALCLCWSVFEFVAASPFWGMLFGALGISAIWQLFIADWPE